MPELLPKTEHEDHLPIVAHKGMVELIDASWNLTKGRTVKFRLVDDADKPIIVHPFTQFVRRRGNRPGTRFNATFVRYGMEDIFYQGELMLMSGGNPLGQGMWVSFWLDADGSDHPFAGCTGRGSDHPGDMFAVAFVELDDDDSRSTRRSVVASKQCTGSAAVHSLGSLDSGARTNSSCSTSARKCRSRRRPRSSRHRGRSSGGDKTTELLDGSGGCAASSRAPISITMQRPLKRFTKRSDCRSWIGRTIRRIRHDAA